MKNKINKVISCILVFTLIANFFAFNGLSLYAAEDTQKDVASATEKPMDGAIETLNGVDTNKEGAKDKAQNAINEINAVRNDTKNGDINGEKSNSLANLTKVTSKVQSALIKVGSTLEKIGATLKKVGQALKIAGSLLKCYPPTAGIGKALISIGKVIYQIGNVMENVGKTIRTVGEAAANGDFNFGNLISNVASTVKAAWTQGGTDYDNFDTTKYTEALTSVFGGNKNGTPISNDKPGDPEGAGM